MLTAAAWKPHRVKIKNTVMELQRGQLLAGRAYLAKTFGWSEKRVRNFLALLESEGVISAVHGKGQQPAIITICNYTKYQHHEISEGQQRASAGPAKGHTEEREEVKEKKKDDMRERDPFGFKPIEPEAHRNQQTGQLSLSGNLLAFWLGKFENDPNRLELALTQAAGYVQINSTKPLEAQIGSQLARIAGEKFDRDSRYKSAAAAKQPSGGNVSAFSEALARRIAREELAHG